MICLSGEVTDVKEFRIFGNQMGVYIQAQIKSYNLKVETRT